MLTQERNIWMRKMMSTGRAAMMDGKGCGPKEEVAVPGAGAEAETVARARRHHVSIADAEPYDADAVQGKAAGMARTDWRTRAVARPRMETELLQAIGDKQAGMLAGAVKDRLRSLHPHRKQ